MNYTPPPVVPLPCPCEDYCWDKNSTDWNQTRTALVDYRCRHLGRHPIMKYWKERGLSTRTAKGLALDGVDAERLAEHSDAEILRIPNLGRKALKEIREIITNPNPAPPFDPKELIEVAALMERLATNLRRTVAAALKQKDWL